MFRTHRHLNSWDPFRELQLIKDQMGKLLGNVSGAPESFGYPVNIWSDDDGYVLTLEIPGLDADSINVNVENNQVSIEAEKKDSIPEGVAVHRKECGTGKMTCAYQLPSHIDQSKVAASYKNGVLSLTLPKSQEAKARKIKITA
ncbi:MAG: Hsp20/alpha crystallin family protein [Kiritimatiellaeota bacterium]|nr:Hsp20/alpha crystallin family protein [Kiritimatiellota bacterium]